MKQSIPIKRMKKVLFSFLVPLVLILSLNQLKVQASGTDSWNDLRMERMLLLDNDELKDSDGIVHLDDSFIDIYTTGALGCYEKNVETGEVTFSPAPEYISDEEPIPYQKETDNNEDEIDSFIIPNSIIGVDSRYKPNSIQAPFVNHCKLIMTFPDGQALKIQWMIGASCGSLEMWEIEPDLGYTAYAIHNYGTSSTRPYNSATVINNWLLNKMRTWKK